MLTHCLHCDYPLDGLPDTHDCPECGKPYCTLDMYIFTRKYSGFLGYSLAILSPIIGIPVLTSTPFEWTNMMGFVILTNIPFGILWGNKARRQHKSCYCRISDKELEICNKLIRQSVVVSTDEVGSIEVDRKASISVTNKENQLIGNISFSNMARTTHIIEFVNQINTSLEEIVKTKH